MSFAHLQAMRMPAFILILLLSGSGAYPAEVLRDPGKLLGWYEKPAQKEKMLRLGNARIVRVHHDRLRRDFPQGLAGLSDAQIEERLLRCVEFISIPQSRQTSVNTEIPLAEDKPGLPNSIFAWRPLGYGRAVVFDCFGGLVDAKGTGKQDMPQPGEYSSGLFTLGKALHEDLMQEVVAILLAREGYQAGTVETYGEVDLGFDAIAPDGKKQRAGMVLRQAHQRINPAGMSLRRGDAVERILRKYGMTSDHRLLETSWHTIDRHNVQMDKDGSIFDFETMYAVENFSNSPVSADPDLRLPFDEWGGWSAAGTERMQAWADELARRFVAGEITRADIDAEFEKRLAPLRRKLAPCGADLKSK